MQSFQENKGNKAPEPAGATADNRKDRLRDLRSSLAQRNGPARTMSQVEAQIDEAGSPTQQSTEPLNLDALRTQDISGAEDWAQPVASPFARKDSAPLDDAADVENPDHDPAPETDIPAMAASILDAQNRLKVAPLRAEPIAEIAPDHVADPAERLDSILADNMPDEAQAPHSNAFPDAANDTDDPSSESMPPAQPTAGKVAGPVSVPNLDDAPATADAPATPTNRRARAKKTRLLGFDQADDGTDLFAKPAPVQDTSASVKFPVGWMVVIEGPGKGENFALSPGVAQIGRGQNQAVRLDFGDTSISRENHAAVAYDPKDNQFTLAQSGKANLVRLNGRPVLSNEDICDRDELRIGKTTLRFIAMCDAKFSWDDEDMGDDT